MLFPPLLCVCVFFLVFRERVSRRVGEGRKKRELTRSGKRVWGFGFRFLWKKRFLGFMIFMIGFLKV